MRNPHCRVNYNNNKRYKSEVSQMGDLIFCYI